MNDLVYLYLCKLGVDNQELDHDNEIHRLAQSSARNDLALRGIMFEHRELGNEI